MVSDLKVKVPLVGLLAALLLAAPAAAAQIFSTGYDMPNGDGTAHGGGLNYWASGYTGSGSTNIDGAALSGGHGDLTDGVILTDSYIYHENLAGTGPYVGWLFGGTRNPVITFYFAGSPTITGITVWAENTGTGGVYAPARILIDGIDTAFTPPSGVGAISFAGLNLTGGSHTLELDQQSGAWEFVSEVTFEGGAVPEPATWAMLISGFGLAGAVLRRRRVAFI